MSGFLDQFDKVPLSQKILLLVLLMLGIFVGYFFIFHSKVEEDIVQQQGRVSNLDNQRGQLSTTVGDIDDLRDDIRELCARQETFLERLPAREEIPTLLQSINQQAELTGLDIQRFVRNANAAGTSYTTIPVSMSLKGSYDQISDFFYFIGRQQRIMNVANITLKLPNRASPWRLTEGRANENEMRWFAAGANEIGPPELEVTCTLRTYFAENSALTRGDACAE